MQLPGHYQFFLIPPKVPTKNQATPKNTCHIFIPKKIPESKISNPKKSFNHPCHLKSQVPPAPPGHILQRHLAVSIDFTHSVFQQQQQQLFIHPI